MGFPRGIPQKDPSGGSSGGPSGVTGGDAVRWLTRATLPLASSYRMRRGHAVMPSRMCPLDLGAVLSLDMRATRARMDKFGAAGDGKAGFSSLARVALLIRGRHLGPPSGGGFRYDPYLVLSNRE